MRRLVVILVLAGCRSSTPAAPEPTPVAPAPTPAVSMEDELGLPPAEPEVEEEPPPPRPQVPLSGRLGPDDPQPPSRPASESVCADLERRAQRKIAQLASPCETASDCEMLGSFCPFGCYHFVAKGADRSTAEAAIDRYLARCRPCKYKCSLPPEALACVEGQCVDGAERSDKTN